MPHVDPLRPRPLVRNVLLNLGGHVAPLCAAVIALPILARHLEADRLGILSLAWAILGFSGFLDLGLGRALTHAVATRLAVHDAESLPAVLSTAWTVLFGLGATAGLGLAALAPWLSTEVLQVPGAAQHEVLVSLYLLACSIPFTTTAAGVRGVLEALQRFDLVNLVRTPLGVVTYLGPVLVLPLSRSAVALVAVLAFARLAALVAYLTLSHKTLPATASRRARPGGREFAEVVRTGAWITMTNVAGSVIAYLDRFVLSSTAPVAVLAYYATPQELVTKLTIVPVALSAVMFPAFAAASASRHAALEKLFDKMSLYILLALFPVTIVGAAFTPELLGLWLGPSFASKSATVVQWFCLGVLANSVAVAPVSLLQGIGRAHLTATLQCVELPVYLGALWWSAGRHGMAGVAVVWAARMVADAGLMFAASLRSLPGTSSRALRVVTTSLLALGAFAAVLAVSSVGARTAVCVGALVGYALLIPRTVASEDREYAMAAWRRLRSRQT